MAEFGFVSVVPGCASARHDWKNTNNTRAKTWQEQEQEREEFNKRQQEQAAKERAQAEAKAKAEAEAKAKQGESATIQSHCKDASSLIYGFRFSPLMLCLCCMLRES